VRYDCRRAACGCKNTSVNDAGEKTRAATSRRQVRSLPGPARPGSEEMSNLIRYYAPNSLAVLCTLPVLCYVTANTFCLLHTHIYNCLLRTIYQQGYVSTKRPCTAIRITQKHIRRKETTTFGEKWTMVGYICPRAAWALAMGIKATVAKGFGYLSGVFRISLRRRRGVEGVGCGGGAGLLPE